MVERRNSLVVQSYVLALDYIVLFVLPSTLTMMHHFVVGGNVDVGVVGLDATVGPCQQFASVVNFHQSMIDYAKLGRNAVIDYSNFGHHTMGPCPWLVVDLEDCRVA